MNLEKEEEHFKDKTPFKSSLEEFITEGCIINLHRTYIKKKNG